MSHLFVNQIKDSVVVLSDVYRLSNKKFRTGKNGSHFMQFTLSDRTGTIASFFWNATDEFVAQFNDGDFVRVDGRAQIYNERLQFIVKSLSKVDVSEVDRDVFIEAGDVDVPIMTNELSELLNSITNPELAAIADAFLDDEEFMSTFSSSFAGIRLHHAYPGGLLEHTLAMMKLADYVGKLYPKIIDRDLLVMGAFLHDVGKTIELTGDSLSVVYSDEGQALGHLYLGAELLAQKIEKLERAKGSAFDATLKLKLRHMIISHHGDPSFGAVKTPMTREALALYLIDSLDSKLYEFQKLIDEETDPEKAWTNFSPILERKILK
ncbi:MAG: 3'-5' exoribonuclease YhaM family protein [Thermoguttaceae bacterium]|jgi:3'-5' exoribonuclease